MQKNARLSKIPLSLQFPNQTSNNQTSNLIRAIHLLYSNCLTRFLLLLVPQGRTCERLCLRTLNPRRCYFQTSRATQSQICSLQPCLQMTRYKWSWADSLQITVSIHLHSVTKYHFILLYSFSGFRSLPDVDLWADGGQARTSRAFQPHWAGKTDWSFAAWDTTRGILHPLWTR